MKKILILAITICLFISGCSSGDSKIESYFDDAKVQSENYISSDSETKGQDLVKELADFVFYDGEINGIKFKDLSKNTQKEIIKSLMKIDNAMETKWPGYKETIESTSNHIYNNLTKQLEALGQEYQITLKQTLGEDAYNIAADAAKSQASSAPSAIKTAISQTKEIFSKAFNSMGNWFKGLLN